MNGIRGATKSRTNLLRGSSLAGKSTFRRGVHVQSITKGDNVVFPMAGIKQPTRSGTHNQAKQTSCGLLPTPFLPLLLETNPSKSTTKEDNHLFFGPPKPGVFEWEAQTPALGDQPSDHDPTSTKVHGGFFEDRQFFRLSMDQRPPFAWTKLYDLVILVFLLVKKKHTAGRSRSVLLCI